MDHVSKRELAIFNLLLLSLVCDVDGALVASVARSLHICGVLIPVDSAALVVLLNYLILEGLSSGGIRLIISISRLGHTLHPLLTLVFLNIAWSQLLVLAKNHLLRLDIHPIILLLIVRSFLASYFN